MPTLRYVTCDVFTDAAFSGNPLAVVFGADGLSTETLQTITREFNYSETVFIMAAGAGPTTRHVRIFTPAAELPFAGHPTLGAAHVLVATGEIAAHGDAVTLVLEEGVGPVPVRVDLHGTQPVRAQLTVARTPDERQDVPGVDALASMLGLDVGDFAVRTLQPAAVSCGLPFLLVPLQSAEAVSRAALDVAAWRTHLEGAWASEVMVFAMSDADTEYDIRARVFVPGLAVPEDPATGSANACLAAYLAARTPDGALPADGTLRWTVAQGVEMGRPSRLFIEADRTAGHTSAIRVAGQTVIVCEGTMHVPHA